MSDPKDKERVEKGKVKDIIRRYMDSEGGTLTQINVLPIFSAIDALPPVLPVTGRSEEEIRIKDVLRWFDEHKRTHGRNKVLQWHPFVAMSSEDAVILLCEYLLGQENEWAKLFSACSERSESAPDPADNTSRHVPKNEGNEVREKPEGKDEET